MKFSSFALLRRQNKIEKGFPRQIILMPTAELNSRQVNNKSEKKNRKEREKNVVIFKKTACVTGIILLGLFGLIGFYSTTLPDFYLVSKGSELSVNSFFTISSKPCESKVTVAVSGGSSGASRYTKNMLMLFGAVPVKEVESKTMERPMLYPCGQPFGIKLLTEGVMVVDLQK